MTKARDLANASTALSAVDATELGYLDGVTSAVQTQLNAKQPTVANVSDTEIGYLDGVSSAIQTQLNAKAPTASPTFTGTATGATFTTTSATNGAFVMRNIYTATSDPSGGSDGDVWIKYTA
jgi:hypothetical protein